MKKVILNLLFVLPLLVFAGCSSDDDDNAELRLVGKWELNKVEVVKMEPAIPDLKEMIENNVPSVVMTFYSDRRVEIEGDEEDEGDTGTYILDGTTLHLTLDGGSESTPFTNVTISSSTLSGEVDLMDTFSEDNPTITNLIARYTWVRK